MENKNWDNNEDNSLEELEKYLDALVSKGITASELNNALADYYNKSSNSEPIDTIDKHKPRRQDTPVQQVVTLTKELEEWNLLPPTHDLWQKIKGTHTDLMHIFYFDLKDLKSTHEQYLQYCKDREKHSPGYRDVIDRQIVELAVSNAGHGNYNEQVRTKRKLPANILKEEEAALTDEYNKIELVNANAGNTDAGTKDVDSTSPDMLSYYLFKTMLYLNTAAHYENTGQSNKSGNFYNKAERTNRLAYLVAATRLAQQKIGQTQTMPFSLMYDDRVEILENQVEDNLAKNKKNVVAKAQFAYEMLTDSHISPVQANEKIESAQYSLKDAEKVTGYAKVEREYKKLDEALYYNFISIVDHIESSDVTLANSLASLANKTSVQQDLEKLQSLLTHRKELLAQRITYGAYLRRYAPTEDLQEELKTLLSSKEKEGNLQDYVESASVNKVKTPQEEIHAGNTAYHFHAELVDFEEANVDNSYKIWRRFQVPQNIGLADFAYVLMAMFEMRASHLYSFGIPQQEHLDINKLAYSRHDDPVTSYEPYPNELREISEPETKIASEYTLEEALKDLPQENTSFAFVYDFGDNWIVKITREETKAQAEKIGKKSTVRTNLLPRIIEGEGFGIIEDVGGTGGLLNLIRLFEEHKKYGKNQDEQSKEEYERLRAWLEYGGYKSTLDHGEDFTYFNLKDANYYLSKLPKIYKKIFEYQAEPTSSEIDLIEHNKSRK